MPSPRRKRSRSKSKEDFKYPANNSKELKALLLQYMNNEKFSCPFDSITLMKNLRMQFKSPLGRIMMKSFSINDLLQELEDKKALKLEPFSLGTSKCFMITAVHREIIQQLSRETSKDRPKKFPNQIIDYNEKFPWLTVKTFANEHYHKPYKPDPLIFSMKGNSKDLKSSDLILVNLMENSVALSQFMQIKEDDLHDEGVIIIRDNFTTEYHETLKKLGYSVVGKISVIKTKKHYTKRYLWGSFTSEELLVGSKKVEVKLPEVIEADSDHELYKEISRCFSGSHPVELFGKNGKDNWILIETI